MTQNQIAYWNMRETERSHRADEKERNRANKAGEAIKSESNRITLSLGQANTAEQVRANLAKELENNRSNLANEDIKRIQNVINALQADIAARNADIRAGELGLGYSNLSEQIRTHQANEALTAQSILETNRANVARETENNRTNVENENIKRFQAAVQGGAALTSNSIESVKAGETAKHNRQVESETKRNNLTQNVLEGLNILAGLKKNKDNNETQIITKILPSVQFRR